MPSSKVQKRLHAMQFLDVEAEESGEEEEEIEDTEQQEEEDEGEGEYLTDSLPEEMQPFQPTRRSDEEFGALVETFLPDPRKRHGRLLENVNVPEYFERITVAGDYPLWRIKCRKHTEEHAMYSLLLTARPHHELRSVFSTGAGYLYLECSMNTQLRELLEKTPGLIVGSRECIPPEDYRETLRISRPSDISNGAWVEITRGVHRGDVGLVVEKRIDGAEVIIIPRMPPPKDFVKSNKRKLRDTTHPPHLFDPDGYKSQFSHEVSLRSEGVYRFRNRTFEHGLERKLFKATFLKPNPDDIPYEFFEIFHASVHPNVNKLCIPRPREWVFHVDEEVAVLSICTNVYKTILTEIKPCHAVVQVMHDDLHHSYEYLKERREIPWQEIRKIVSLGDYVQIQGGPDGGDVGWVTNITNDIVTIVNIEVNGTVLEAGQSHSIRKTTRAHINTLQKCEVPHQYARSIDTESRKVDISSYVVVTGGQYVGFTGWVAKIEGENAFLLENVPDGGVHTAKEYEHLEIPLKFLFRTQSSQVPGDIAPLQNIRTRQSIHPWEGIEIIVSKTHNAFKGFQGTIKRVRPGQHDISQTRIDVQSSNYNPFKPFATYTFSYDEICEKSTHKRLNDFCPVDRRITKTNQILPSTVMSEALAPSSSTPCYPMSEASTSPAWDPLSRTPGPNTLMSPLSSLTSPLHTSSHSPSFTMSSPSNLSSPSSTSSPHASNLRTEPSHPFLNASLHGISLRAMLDGKEGVVSVDAVDGRCSIRRKEYRLSVLVPPETVTPKHPNPAKDNGLLVVIKGEHAMKFVRRIHHRNKIAGRPMILAVVTRSDNKIDELTGEQLELTAEHLCIVVESEKNKELNSQLMNSLREQYKGKKL